MLTKGLDNVAGTAGNDTIIGSIDNTGVGANAELQTLSNLDIVNGGAGIDTLKINVTGGPAVGLPNLSNVEIIEVSSAAGATVSTAGVAGVTNLNVIKATGAVAATADATTDVGVSVKGITGTNVVVNGGKNVNVTTTDAAATIDAGAAGADVTGAVTISATGAAASNANAAVALGTIAVGGGTTINVTQKATSDASALVAGAAATTHTQGKVTVAAGATTTSVTLKQDAAVAADSVAAVTGATEAASVKFTKLDAGESVTISGLTFTAAVGKNLTADQVAQAFANLSASAIKPTQIAPPSTATSDTQGSGASANGTFTGALLADWTSGAATADTVVFTGKANTAMAPDLATTTPAKATVTTTTQGVTAVAAKNVLGVVNGVVDITGAAALKTVTVDGYAASTGANGINGATNNALDTISLANGGNFEIDSAAAALGLTLANVNGTVTVTAGTKTLNAAVSHAKATETTTLVSASAETVNVTGTGNVAGTTAAGNLAAATAINTTGMTAGKATFAIDNGTVTTYTGGAGVDSVTVTNAATAITKAIDLGAGDDTLTLNGAAVAPTATLKGGDGTDTIAMTGARAEALSANATFAGKIEGFEKLSITDKVAAAATVNMANMDGITYVVSNNANATAASAGATQKFVFDVAGLDLNSLGTLSVGGVVIHTNNTGANELAAAIGTALNTTTATINSVVYNITTVGSVVTLTSTAPVAAQPAVAVTTAGQNTAITNAGVTVTPGAAAVVAGTSFLTIDKMANNGTLELVGSGDGVVVKMADATGSTDSFNIVTKVSTAGVGNLTFGTVDVAGVETLKLNAVDTEPTVTAAGVTTPSIQTATLNLKADKATSLTIEGSSNVTLTLDATTTKLATIDAGTLTGNLDAGNTLNAVAMTITGGKGADVLKASMGATAKADVLNGGDGNDTLYAGSNGAKLTGGAGNDLFFVKATLATDGNKESNTYSEILDFQAGDVLQLQYSNAGAAADVASLTKLAAVLNENTAVFSDFVNAAIKEAAAGAATWFNYKGDAYVVVDSHTNSAGDTFINGEDLIVKLTGINGDNLSFNSDYGTAALI